MLIVATAGLLVLPAQALVSFRPALLRFGFFGEYSNLKYYRILHSKQCRMNEISRKFPEFSSSVKKGLGGEGESQTWRK